MLRKVPSKSVLRSIHTSTQKPNPSVLLNNVRSQYQAMSVNSLKSELKNRGLRVSGRKAELVDRLAGNDARRHFGSTHQPEQKGDESHIDFFHIPESKPEPKVARMTIPVVPDHDNVAKVVETTEPVQATPDAASTPAAVHSVGGRTVSSMNTDFGDSAHHEEHEESEKLPGRDKTILAGLIAGVAAFWGGDAVWKRARKSE